MPAFAYPNIQSPITILIDQLWNNTHCDNNDTNMNNFDDYIDIGLDDDIQIHFDILPPRGKAPGEIMI